LLCNWNNGVLIYIERITLTLCYFVHIDNVGAEFWKLQTNFGGELNGMQ